MLIQTDTNGHSKVATLSIVVELRRMGMLSGGEPPIAPWEVPKDKGAVEMMSDGVRLHLALEIGRFLRDRRHVSARRILGSFVGLVGAGRTRVLRFARRFGALGLHGEGVPFAAVESLRPITVESIEAYTRHARLAAGVLRLAHRLQRAADDEHVRAEADDIRVIGDHWRWWEAQRMEYQKRHSILFPFQAPQFGMLLGGGMTGSSPGIPPARDHLLTRHIIEQVVNWWLETSFAGPLLQSRGRQWMVVTDSGGAWGAIGMCIAHAIRRGANVAVCNNCGDPVVRGRRAAEGRRSWCDRDECQRTKWRKEKQRQRD